MPAFERYPERRKSSWPNTCNKTIVNIVERFSTLLIDLEIMLQIVTVGDRGAELSLLKNTL